MTTAGIDVGIQTAKAVIINSSGILSYAVIPGGSDPIPVVAEKVLNQAAKNAGISVGELSYIVSTGSSNEIVPMANSQSPDSISLARATNWLMPSVKIVLDIGAQKSISVKCQNGKAVKVARNGRCAAGSGLYLEMVAKIFGVSLEGMTDLSTQAKENLEVQSICAVFAESEIISLVHAKKNPPDIIKGVYSGLSKRLYPLLDQVSLEKDVAIVGGVARNRGMIIALQEMVGYDLLVPENPDIMVALGAALIAEDKAGAEN